MLLLTMLLIAAHPGDENGSSTPSAYSLTDYPPEALLHHWQGRVAFQLDVDPTGRVAGCRITRSSGHDVLDRETCTMMTRRARFTPARDSAGNAIASPVTKEMVWKIAR